MEIDPRRLRVLWAVARRGGVAAAAPLLHLTPSAVSQQIAQLEREVGVAVLDRGPRGVTLTEAGRHLAATGERIEAELTEARRALSALTGRVAGPVTIAAFPTAIAHLIVPAVRALAAEHPAIEPRIVELEGESALRELTTGTVDVLIDDSEPGIVPQPSGTVSVPLLADPYRVVVPTAWQRTPGGLADLAQDPWIVGPSGSAVRRALDRLADEHGFRPLAAHECIEFPAVLALVAAGLGAAVVPALALAGGRPPGVAATSLSALGGRYLSAMHRAYRTGASPAVAVTVTALMAAGRAVTSVESSEVERT
ncbi:LysR family transcriptional regulator [Micromonospora sp. MS34]|uniref:LysR family transcriptional regulator n=1 Tax=Micromonospora sp. MS34 TaxID=3385971 RepID=UPI0039A1E76F